jgi:hypothetical protein
MKNSNSAYRREARLRLICAIGFPSGELYFHHSAGAAALYEKGINGY